MIEKGGKIVRVMPKSNVEQVAKEMGRVYRYVEDTPIEVKRRQITPRYKQRRKIVSVRKVEFLIRV